MRGLFIRLMSVNELSFGRCVEGFHVNVRLIVRLFTEYNRTINECEEGMVFAKANIFARTVFSTTLTNDDVTCNYFLASEYFNAEAFAMGFASVLGTTDAFLVSHFLKL